MKTNKSGEDEEAKDGERSQDEQELSRDRPAGGCCVLPSEVHNNQSQKVVARQGNLCQNFEIGKVPPSKLLPPMTPSEAAKTSPKASKDVVLVLRRELHEDDSRKGHLWGLNPNIWVRLSKPEREAWDALNVSARASRPERDRVPAFLRARGAPKSSTPTLKSSTFTTTKAYASRGGAKRTSFTVGLLLRRALSVWTTRRRVLPFDSTVDGGVSYITYIR